MEITLTKKELLMLLDVLIFVHAKFHKEEFPALTGTDNESRIRLRSKVIESLVDLLSSNDPTVKISFSEMDKTNIQAAFNNFMMLAEYEKEGRFSGQDILGLENKFK